jgi:hypothetical protein
VTFNLKHGKEFLCVTSVTTASRLRRNGVSTNRQLQRELSRGSEPSGSARLPVNPSTGKVRTLLT